MPRLNSYKAKTELKQEISYLQMNQQIGFEQEVLQSQYPSILWNDEAGLKKGKFGLDNVDSIGKSFDSEIKRIASTLSPENFVDTQIELNQLLCRYTSAESAFLLFPTRDGQILYLRVIGEKDVGPITFSITGSAFETILREQLINPRREICEANRLFIKRLSSVEVETFLCIPYFPSRNIAKITFLICLVNKKYPASGTIKMSMANSRCSLMQNCEFGKEDEAVVARVLKVFGPKVMESLALHKEVVYTEKQYNIKKLQNSESSVEDLSKNIGNIMMKAKDILGAENCSFFIVDEKNAELIGKFFDGMTLENSFKEIRISIENGIYGQVAETGIPVIINREFNLQLSNKIKTKNIEVFVRNMICFPIKYKDKTFAVAEFRNKMGDNCFISEDRELCIVLAQVIKDVLIQSLWEFIKL